MTVETDAELQALKRIGRIVGETLARLAVLVEPGMTTGDLDTAGHEMLDAAGATSAPPRVYGFPGDFCISVNDEAAHGIPGDRALVQNDLIKIDLTAELGGYMADAAVTVLVQPASAERRAMVQAARETLRDAIRTVRAGRQLAAIGRAAETSARRRGFTVIPELCGHGVGRTIHEDPRYIPNVDDPRLRERMRRGAVLAIEPHLTTGSGRIGTRGDGWTIGTIDRAPVANFEHTVVVTNGAPLILTAV
jgi:methionyl aminopeptidase